MYISEQSFGTGTLPTCYGPLVSPFFHPTFFTSTCRRLNNHPHFIIFSFLHLFSFLMYRPFFFHTKAFLLIYLLKFSFFFFIITFYSMIIWKKNIYLYTFIWWFSSFLFCGKLQKIFASVITLNFFFFDCLIIYYFLKKYIKIYEWRGFLSFFFFNP